MKRARINIPSSTEKATNKPPPAAVRTPALTDFFSGIFLSQMLHILQTVLRSFHRCRANVKKPKSNIMYIATRGPPVMLKRAVTIITMYNFNARNTVDKVILFKEKFVEQVAH